MNESIMLTQLDNYGSKNTNADLIVKNNLGATEIKCFRSTNC